MEHDREMAKHKKQELVGLAKEAILKYWCSAGFDESPGEAQKVAAEIIGDFTRVTPPEKEPIGWGLFIMRPGGRGGGRSIKPGNILLNFRKLVASVAAGGLTVVGAVAVPWTGPLAALVVWDILWSNLKAEVSEREAAIIWTMWVNREDNGCVSDAELLDAVNSEFKRNGRSSISREELDDSLATLNRMGCIKRSKTDASMWWLREWVRVDF